MEYPGVISTPPTPVAEDEIVVEKCEVYGTDRLEVVPKYFPPYACGQKGSVNAQASLSEELSCCLGPACLETPGVRLVEDWLLALAFPRRVLDLEVISQMGLVHSLMCLENFPCWHGNLLVGVDNIKGERPTIQPILEPYLVVYS